MDGMEHAQSSKNIALLVENDADKAPFEDANRNLFSHGRSRSVSNEEPHHVFLEIPSLHETEQERYRRRGRTEGSPIKGAQLRLNVPKSFDDVWHENRTLAPTIRLKKQGQAGSKTPGVEGASYKVQREARFADDMNFEYRNQVRDGNIGGLLKRSLTGLVRNVSEGGEAAMEKIALLVDEDTKKTPTETFTRILLFELVLVSGMLLYRGAGCKGFGVYCKEKKIPRIWKEIVSLLIFGGIIYSTGPTLTRKLAITSMTSFLLSLFGFGFLGQVSFLNDSTLASDWYTVPSVFIYILAFIGLVSVVFYSIAIAPSRHDRRLTYYLILTTALFFTISFLVAYILVDGAIYHVHHYQIAFFGTLFLRHPEDKPSTIMRWALIGVFVHGVTAYGFGNEIST